MYKRKGVTPVVATTMLVLIAIAASVTAYSFIESTIQGFQDRTEDELTEEELSTGSDIGIDSAYEKTSNGNIEMVVRNTGRYSVAHENWQLYVDGGPEGINWDSEISGDGINPQETETVDTGVEFPSSGEKVIEIRGEYVRTSFVCISGSDRC